MLARARALNAQKGTEQGALSAKSVFSRLVSPPGTGPEASATPTQAAHVFRVGGQKVGALKFDAVGRPSMRMSVKLSGEQQQALLRAIQGFVDAL